MIADERFGASAQPGGRSRRPGGGALLACLGLGVLAGGVLGAVRTREAALHLLAKNGALLDAGIPALPGTGHLETMGSWAPAGAGALFFALSLGLGGAALLAAAAGLLGTLPGPWGRRLPWATVLAPALLYAWGRDPGLAAAALAPALAAGRWGAGPGPSRQGILPVACALLALLGLLPWARAPEGGFTRFRDRVLLARPTGPALALDTFYYRWTLYPAEAIKPLRARSQPAVWVDPAAPSREAACRDLARLGVWCVDRAEAADARLLPGPDGPRLRAGNADLAWPRDPASQREAWTRLSDRHDPARPLRRATAAALFLGCPLVLAGLLGALAVWLGSWMPAEPQRRLGALVCALLLAGLVAAVSRPPPWLARVRAELADPRRPDPQRVREGLAATRPAERFYAARAAGRLGPGWEEALARALEDPVINVRYAAAESLGRIGTPGAREILARLIDGPADWYVKERAWAGLRRLGWRPGP
ncbi:HEAT repeat domain-containing protein [Deferrisoma palaeochoriense]